MKNNITSILDNSIFSIILFILVLLPINSHADNIPLNMIFRWYINVNTDHISTFDPSVIPGGTPNGQTFYIARDNIAGTHVLNRLFDPAVNDHMPSLLSGEGSYALEGLLGYLLSDPIEGTVEAYRWFKPTDIDHMFAENGDPETTGFDQEGVMGHAFPRFKELCEVNELIDLGNISVSLNKVAGGAINGITWNGKQFVNKFDYGRLIQTALNFTNVAEEDNPTEGGSKYSCPGVSSPTMSQGSPVLSLTRTTGSITTRTHPLQFIPENQGGDSTHPVMWTGVIQKKLSLESTGTGIATMIKYTSTVEFPQNRSFLDMLMVVAYLTADFSDLYVYDSNLDQLTLLNSDVDSLPGSVKCLDPNSFPLLRPTSGGPIAATPDGNFAMGLLRTHPTNATAVCRITGGSGAGPTDFPASVLVMFQRDNTGGITAGLHSWFSHMVVGTLSQVRAAMLNGQGNAIFSDGFESGNASAWSSTAP